MLMGPPLATFYNVNARVPGAMAWFVHAAQWATDGTAGTFTSWWRSPAENYRVGGARESQHLVALAVDFAAANRNDHRWIANRARAAGMVAVDEGDHVHLQLWPAGTARALGLV